MKKILFIPIVALVSVVLLVLVVNNVNAHVLGEMKEGTKIVAVSADTYTAQTAKGIVLVDFWAPWCGPCRKMNPVLEAVAAENKGVATVAKLNVDDNKDLSISLKVSSIPTIIVYKDGKEVDRIVGVVSQEHLNKVIQVYATAK